jgi:hypothetical protein
LLVDDDDAFRDLGRDEAAAAAQELILSLDARASGGPGGVEIDGGGVRVRVGAFVLLVCARAPGRPYQPQQFADADARAAAAALDAVLRPPPGAEQELYFNTRHFDG